MILRCEQEITFLGQSEVTTESLNKVKEEGLNENVDVREGGKNVNNKTFLPNHLCEVKFFLADESNALIQKSLVFRNFKDVLIFDTLNIFKCSAPPLALL